MGLNVSPMCRAALAYTERLRWPVFPLAGKVPALRGSRGCLDATLDPRQVEQWWSQQEHNIGLAAGAAAGWWALDVDGEKGEETLAELIRLHGPLPETVEQLTGGGGRHLLFQHDSRVRNTARFAPNLDTRTDGGYIVGAPSVHPNGRTYHWEVDHHPVMRQPAVAPEWLIDLIAAPRRQACDAAALSMASDELAYLLRLGVGEGRRNETMTRLAGALMARNSPLLALELLRAANTACFRPPLPDRDVEGIADRIAERELRKMAELSPR